MRSATKKIKPGRRIAGMAGKGPTPTPRTELVWNRLALDAEQCWRGLFTSFIYFWSSQMRVPSL